MVTGHANPLVKGDYLYTQSLVCDDGQIRTVSFERYTLPSGKDGFMFLLFTDPKDQYTNRCLYASVRQARKAAASCIWSNRKEVTK